MKLGGITMVHHHVCYEEIHGYDLVILMPIGEHRKLHNRLRREGNCQIPSKELHKISIKAYKRGYNPQYYKAHSIEMKLYVSRTRQAEKIYRGDGL